MSIKMGPEPDGTFGGTLFATVAPEFLKLLYDSVNLGQTGSVIESGTDGAVRAYPYRHRDVGTGDATAREDGSAAGSKFQHFALPPLKSKGAYEGADAADGIRRLYHWRKIEGYPLIVLSVSEKPTGKGAWVISGFCSLAVHVHTPDASFAQPRNLETDLPGDQAALREGELGIGETPLSIRNARTSRNSTHS